VGGCPIDEFVAAARRRASRSSAAFPASSAAANAAVARWGDLPHAARAAATTLVLHHPILLEPLETIDRLAAGLQKVAAVLGGGQGLIPNTSPTDRAGGCLTRTGARCLRRPERFVAPLPCDRAASIRPRRIVTSRGASMANFTRPPATRCTI